MRRRALALAILAAAVGIAGCGEDDEDSEATTSAQQVVPRPQDGGGRQDSGATPAGRNSQQGTTRADLGPVVENPTNEQLGVEPGADNSLQMFGSTAEGDERDELIARMRAFFEATVKDGVQGGCPYFSASYRQSLEQGRRAMERQTGLSFEDGCAALTAMLRRSGTSGTLRQDARSGLNATVLRVGIRSEDAIVMLRTGNGQLAYFTMQRENGEWVTNSLGLSQLPPGAR